MRCHCRSADRRFYPSQAYCGLDEAQAPDKPLSIDFCSIEFERQHGTEAAHLRLREFMIRGAGETGIIHPEDLILTFQVTGDAARVFSLPPDSDCKRHEASFKQGACLGIQTSSQVRSHGADTVCLRPRGDRDAAADIAVPAQVFRAAVHHNVDAQRPSACGF